MKVGTDAIVLGSWAASLPLSPSRILDIGTGTGIILFMLMQELSPALGIGIDIAECLQIDTVFNQKSSPWNGCTELILGDVLVYTPEERFDLIVSNPPYFEAEGVSCLNYEREQARREQKRGLTLRRLMHKASQLLEPKGELLLITPLNREQDLRLYATEALLRLSRYVIVYSLPGKPLRLLSGWKPLLTSESYQPTNRNTLTLRKNDGSYTSEYLHLTAPFLL